MFLRITIKNVAAITLLIWGLAIITWYFTLDGVRSSSTHLKAHKTSEHKISTSTEDSKPFTSFAILAPKIVVWSERNPYTKLMTEAVNSVIDHNEDWKVVNGCSDDVITYASIPLAVNTLTLTTAFFRYFAIVSLRTVEKFKSWSEQPHVQRMLQEALAIVRHTIDVDETQH